MIKRARTLSFGLLLSCATAFCTVPSDECPSSAGHTPEFLEAARSIQYELDWDDTGITEQSDGWSTVSNEGIRWTLSSGYIVSLRAELIPCSTTNIPETCDKSLWRSFARPSIALAGHGDDAPDPSRRGIGRVESLLDLSTHIEPAFEIEGPAHCQAHYLVHKAYGFTENLPAEIDMIGQTLWVEGTYELPTGGGPTSFIAHTEYSNGHLGSLIDPMISEPTMADGRSEAWLVRIIRSPARLFEGIDPTDLNPEELGDALLWNLVDHTQVQLISQ